MKPRGIAGWFGATLAAIGLSVAIGSSDIPLGRLARALDGDPGYEGLRRVVFDVRLPRALVAWLVGAALGVSGCALQGLFRNPLADPTVLGVSASAALMAQLVLFLGLPAGLTLWMVPASAMLGAAAAMVVLLSVAGDGHLDAPETLILAGVALGQIAIAGSALLVSLALADFTVAQRLVQWMLGSLEGRTWLHVWWGAGPTAVGVVVLVSRARQLDALLLGELTATSLGVDVRRLRQEVVISTALLTGASIAVGGIVAFVGLIVPHALRRLVGANHEPLLIASVFAGGSLVVIADLIARRVAAPTELQIGVITAALGAPWFMLLLHRRLREVSV